MQATRRRPRLPQQCKNNNNNEHAQPGGCKVHIRFNTKRGVLPGNTIDEYREPWLKF
jgi:hypothetical protein